MLFYDSSAFLAVEPLVTGLAMMVDASSLLFFHTRLDITTTQQMSEVLEELVNFHSMIDEMLTWSKVTMAQVRHASPRLFSYSKHYVSTASTQLSFS